MSKLKSIWHYGLSVASFCGAISTVTGHGLVHVGASILRVRLPPRALGEIAKYQFKNAEKQWEKGDEEWEKLD